MHYRAADWQWTPAMIVAREATSAAISSWAAVSMAVSFTGGTAYFTSSIGGVSPQTSVYRRLAVKLSASAVVRVWRQIPRRAQSPVAPRGNREPGRLRRRAPIFQPFTARDPLRSPTNFRSWHNDARAHRLAHLPWPPTPRLTRGCIDENMVTSLTSQSPPVKWNLKERDFSWISTLLRVEVSAP